MSDVVDQSCGCKADPDFKCDCEIQGACICTADCPCNSKVCSQPVSAYQGGGITEERNKNKTSEDTK